MSVTSQAEQVRLATGEELHRFQLPLRNAGITWSEPELVVQTESIDKYSAELRVCFYESSNLIDIFEFFVCKDGVPTTSEDEVRQWIRDNVPDVIQRRAHRSLAGQGGDS